VKNQGKFQFQKIFAAHLRNSHGTLVCHGTQFENHWSKGWICPPIHLPGYSPVRDPRGSRPPLEIEICIGKIENV